MKKLSAFLSAGAFVLMFGAVRSQIINPCFDTWIHQPAGGLYPVAYDDPNMGPSNNGWLTLNITSSSILGSSPLSVFKDSVSPTPFSPCNYSARILTVPLTHSTNSMMGKYLPDTIIGLLATGQGVLTPSPKLIFGYPFGTRITQLYFYYQYAPVSTDTASARIVLRSHYGHTLGAGILTVTTTVSSWTQGTVNIVYDSAAGKVDSIDVVFSSSSWHKPHAGSQFWIDNVTTNPASESNLFVKANSVNVYPNPATSQVNFSIAANPGKEYMLEVYDMTGKKMNSYTVQNNFAAISTSGYAPGLYLYRLCDRNGEQLNIGKFSVIR